MMDNNAIEGYGSFGGDDRYSGGGSGPLVFDTIVLSFLLDNKKGKDVLNLDKRESDEGFVQTLQIIRTIKLWAEGKEGISNPLLIEAETIRKAIINVRLEGWRKVVIMSSNKGLIHKI
ncbi:hypothetical protein ACH5RR_029812 [Cinchona calisaya]|uniref:Uncharacterized protein n=1 Tax=Cinchona calisaya TaxID=153742 RepID=A0ABD2YSQ8_9GENT